MTLIRSLLVAATLAGAAFDSSAAEVSQVSWLQSSSTAGDCADCTIMLTKTTPQIVQVASNNGWKGFVVYSSTEDKYKGAMQSPDYPNVVVVIEMTYEGKTLALRAKSSAVSFSSTYRKK